MKKIQSELNLFKREYSRILFIIVSFFLLSLNKVFAAPDFWTWDTWLPWVWNEADVIWTVFGAFIVELIKYVAVIAVIALMLSGIMYIVSFWEEEKIKKAKNWIIWSLVGVFLSVSAYTIIWFINKIYINN